MPLDLDLSEMADPAACGVEIVERKGLGHPDTICDALAEELSIALSRFYVERFGVILHHNVDKVLLWGGTARPVFGGGDVVAPMEIFLAGRATHEYKGIRVPVEEFAVEGSRAWLRRHLRGLDPVRQVKIHCLVRPGSLELVELFERHQRGGPWLANDSSIGAGYAPLSSLERTVLAVERAITRPGRRVSPAFGEDVKVLGVRRGRAVELTVSCAFISRHIADLEDYLRQKRRLGALVTTAAKRAGTVADVAVNAADDPQSGSIYLTVTGTSAESGDDGQAGRGNRANGLITPLRPMTMESVAGKNPVSHVGKLYNVVAHQIAASVVANVPGVSAAECYLASRIGRPVSEPKIAALRVASVDGQPAASLKPAIEPIVADHLARLDGLWRSFVAHDLSIY